ncbi:MAG: amidohydrolase family protein [Gemmataceae bacterium]
MASTERPEHNVTGIDFAERRHFRYAGPLFDIHAHVMQTRSADSPDAPGSLEQAETMLAVAAEFGVERIWSMCPPEDIPPLRRRFGDRLGFNGPVSKKSIDEPDDAAYKLLDRFLEQGVEIIKYWSAPRGRERGLFVDASWRIECTRRAIAAGLRVFMVHVADPDTWFRTVYADAAKCGTKAEQYAGLDRMLQMFPQVTWIAAHMGGDPEHADHLEALLERYPNLRFDTSATKWQVREVSAHRGAIRALVCRRPDRFLFGSDLVTRPGLVRDHYVSRYWCQRTLWESAWEGRSPIEDPDFEAEGETPMLRGLALPPEVLARVYRDNTRALFGR